MVFSKSENNPLVTKEDVNPSARGFQVIGAFNPGAVIYKNEFILLMRTAENCVPVSGKVRVPVYQFNPGEKGVPAILEFEENDPDLCLKDTRGVVYKNQDYLSSVSHIRLARSTDGINFKVEDYPFICPSSADEVYGIEEIGRAHV